MMVAELQLDDDYLLSLEADGALFDVSGLDESDFEPSDLAASDFASDFASEDVLSEAPLPLEAVSDFPELSVLVDFPDFA
jgi:hypothetical protein